MKGINFYFLNVGEGDSTVVEIEDTQNAYILIDCNLVKRKQAYSNPALEFFQSRNINKIDAVIISHFHKDHFFGIEDILNLNIGKICIPPVLSRKSKQFDNILNKYKSKLKKVLDCTNDELPIKQVNSFAHLIKYIVDNEDKVEELSGPESNFRISSINSSLASIYLPLLKFKGVLFKKIMGEDFTLDNFKEMNDLSAAILFNHFNKKVLLTADSTLSQWKEHKKNMLRNGINNLAIDYLKIPHHGSRYNMNADLLDYLTDSKKDISIFVSADGISHPHNEIFKLVTSRSLKPYCTNLANQCTTNILKGGYIPSQEIVAKQMLPFLSNYRVHTEAISCQGDIKLSINPNESTITWSTNLPCIYR